MKNIIINLIILFVFLNAYAQKDKDIYILMQNLPEVSSKNDSTVVELYKINFNNDKFKRYQLSVDKSGNLVKTIHLKSITEKSITFSYVNFKGSNNPTLVERSNFINILTYEEIINNVMPNNFLEVLKQFENIYIIDDCGVGSEYFIAKKVNLTEKMRL